MSMNQIEKIQSRSMVGSSLFKNQRNPENQKFFPFYYFSNFKVRKDDPIYCDYCGEELNGNGSYETAYFVWENAKTIKICCSILEHFKSAIWDYHHQIIGQPKPIKLPEESTPEMRLVFRWVFGSSKSSEAYKIMSYKKISSWEVFKEIKDNNFCGGSYHYDDAKFYQWNSNKLTSYNSIAEKGYEHVVVLQLSQSQILQLVNEMLFAMKCFQLKLF